MNLHILTGLGLTAVLSASHSFAQESAILTNETDTAELSAIIVTATRTEQTVDDTLAPVTVITEEDIERQQALTLQDVLRAQPGISISSNGGAGKATSVFMRGTESDHVLVLIDGIKVGSATLGTVAFQDIPVEQIERIEIIRGPRSSLYGSEAVGGVIQIFTRKGGGALRSYFNIGSGSYETYKASAGISGGGTQSWFNLSLSGIDTQGFNTCDGDPNLGGCFTFEPDDDDYQNLSGSLRVGHEFNNGAEVDAFFLRSDSDNEFDGGFTNETESQQQVLGASFSFNPLEYWQFKLTAGRSWDESDNFKDGAFSSQFETERDTLSWQNDFFINEQQIATLGVDYQNDSISSSNDFEVTDRDNTGIFAQYQGEYGQQNVHVALRYDDNEQFGDETTGSLAWSYQFSEALRANASYSTAFKAPTFNELYFPDFGNANLTPEELASFEIGLAGDADWGSWTLNLYESQIDDLISFDSETFAPANIAKSRIRGLEATLLTELGDWELNANLTLLDPENRSEGSNKGNDLPRRTKQALRLELDRDFGRYRLGTTIIAEGSRFDNLANTTELDSFVTVDLRAEYQWAPAWKVQAKVANVFDEDYETANFFNQPGRHFFINLNYQPE